MFPQKWRFRNGHRHSRSARRPNPRPAGTVIARIGVPLVAAAVVIIGLMWILGSVLVNGSARSILGRTDQQTTEWAVAHRSPTLDTLTHLGSTVADTSVALVVTAVAVVGFRLWLGRRASRWWSWSRSSANC